MFINYSCSQEADCQGDPLEGDILKWEEEKWVAEDDVTIAPLARETVSVFFFVTNSVEMG